MLPTTTSCGCTPGAGTTTAHAPAAPAYRPPESSSAPAAERGVASHAEADGRAFTRANHAPTFLKSGLSGWPTVCAEIEEAKEQDVGEGEALAAEEFAPVRHLSVQPFQAVLRQALQAVGGFRRGEDAAP